jgi:hypothetical protein
MNKEASKETNKKSERWIGKKEPPINPENNSKIGGIKDGLRS